MSNSDPQKLKTLFVEDTLSPYSVWLHIHFIVGETTLGHAVPIRKEADSHEVAYALRALADRILGLYDPTDKKENFSGCYLEHIKIPGSRYYCANDSGGSIITVVPSGLARPEDMYRSAFRVIKHG